MPRLFPNLSFWPRLAPPSSRHSQRALEWGHGWGQLLVALGDPGAAAALWVRAQHPSHSSGDPPPGLSSCSSSHSARWSIIVTSSERPDPAFLGTGSAGGPPTLEPYQPRGWRAQVTIPDLGTTSELVFQAQTRPTVEIPKAVPGQRRHQRSGSRKDQPRATRKGQEHNG